MFEYGDSVRVKATGEIGIICDIRSTEKQKRYIIDKQPYTHADNADEWLIEAAENELEPQ